MKINNKFSKVFPLISLITLCTSGCNIQGAIKEFSFCGIDVDYYYYRKPDVGFQTVCYADYPSIYTTNFEYYGNYINDANFYNVLEFYFDANDFTFDKKERGLEVEYSFFGENFMPFNPNIYLKKGEQANNGEVADRDIYDRRGITYELDKNSKKWIDGKILLDFGDFEGLTPYYLRLNVKTYWLVRYDSNKGNGEFWSSEFNAFFRLMLPNSDNI